MKSLIDTVEQHINQLEDAELKKWLLHHFNKEATHLGALFSKHHPADGSVPSQINSSSELYFIYNLIYTYGPQALIPELQARAASLDSERITDYNHSFLALSTARLNDFRDAWPLLNQLDQQPQELIHSMRQAPRTALQAFKRLVTLDSDWSLLTDLFLVRDTSGMQVIDSQKLINFLRQPKWVNQFRQLIKSLKAEAQALLSIHWLMNTINNLDELTRLQRMQAFYTEHPFTLDKNVLKAFVARYIPLFQQKESLPICQQFLILLDSICSNIGVEQQLDLVKALTVFDRMDLMEHCIRAQLLVDAAYKDAYRRVLMVLCVHTAASRAEDRELIRLQLIKIGQLPFIFPDELDLQHPFELIHSLAQAISALNITPSANNLTIEHMKLRYRCLVLTYTHAELMEFITPAVEISPYYQVLMSQLDTIQRALDDNPHQRELIEKKCRLVMWFTDRMLDELLEQLILECSPNEPQPEVLNTLFNYYCPEGSSLRTDLLFHAVNHFYASAEKQTEVVKRDEAQLKQWCRASQGKWDRALLLPVIYLYNENSTCIALVDGRNRVWSLVEEEPVLVGQGQKEQDYFDSERGGVGSLTDSGHFKPSGAAHQAISAHILGTIPIEELEKSPRGLFLLITHLLLQSNVHLLYEYKEFRQGSLKRLWFEAQCRKVIKELTYPLARSTANDLLAHCHKDQFFSLIPSVAYTPNALSLFHSFLTNKSFCALWRHGAYTPIFHEVLGRHGAIFLAEYLLQYHRMAWFIEGLALFAAYPQRHQHGLLPEALSILSTQVQNNQLPVKRFNAVLRRLSGSEAAAQILLEHFGQDNAKQPVQEVNNQGFNSTLKYFDKYYLMQLIRRLNVLSSWKHCHQYRLALFILKMHHETLFQPAESEISPWRAVELSDFATFINRHLEEKSLWDNKSSIGFKVLGAFTFYHAEQGQTSLFSKGPNKLSRVAAFLVSPMILEQLVDKFIIPYVANDEASVERSTFKERRAYREQLASQLPNNTTLQDWHKLVQSTEGKLNKYIPLLGLYLLHYSGPSSAVQQVLERYVLSVKVGKQNSLIHPISELMVHFPQRDISAVIYDSLHSALMRKPLLLDLTILGHLAHYWSGKEGVGSTTPCDLEMHLISQWGNRKGYALVHQACQLVLSTCQDDVVRQKLEKALVEAEVESRIHHHLQASSKFYAASVKWLTRLWHYGFQWERSKSELLVLADADDPLSASRLKAFSPSLVSSGLVVKKEHVLKEREDAIHLLTQVVRSAFSASGRWLVQSRSRLFDFKALPTTTSEVTLEQAGAEHKQEASLLQ